MHFFSVSLRPCTNWSVDRRRSPDQGLGTPELHFFFFFFFFGLICQLNTSLQMFKGLFRLEHYWWKLKTKSTSTHRYSSRVLNTELWCEIDNEVLKWDKHSLQRIDHNPSGSRVFSQRDATGIWRYKYLHQPYLNISILMKPISYNAKMSDLLCLIIDTLIPFYWHSEWKGKSEWGLGFQKATARIPRHKSWHLERRDI